MTIFDSKRDGALIPSHNEAELLRLRMGMDGCGCSLCQEYYQTLDLSNYGYRVKRFGDITVISAGFTGADLFEAPDPQEKPTNPEPFTKEVLTEPAPPHNARQTSPNKREPVTSAKVVDCDHPPDVTDNVTELIYKLAKQNKPTRYIAKALRDQGIEISHMTVARRLRGQGVLV